MKSLHLSTYLTKGGAAIAASRCIDSLLEAGVQCTVISSECSQYFGEPARANTYFSNRIELWLAKLLETNNGILHSYGLLSGVKNELISYINCSGFDVVHIHWVQGGFLSLFQISKINKPIVWHLHDLWPLSASAHYPGLICTANPYNIKKLINGELMSSSFFSRYAYSLKRKIIEGKSITFVSPSRWISGLARPLLSNTPSCLVEIPFPFKQSPLTREKAKITGIPFNQVFTLCIGGSGYFSNPWKGSKDGLNTLIGLGEQGIKIKVICFGEKVPAWFSRIACKYHELIDLGCVENERVLAALRGSSLYMSTSWVESYGLTVAEALSVGTPCVAYSNTGCESIINNNVDGICVEYRNVAMMVDRIKELVGHPSLLLRLQEGASSHEDSSNSFSPKMHDLYQKLCSIS